MNGKTLVLGLGNMILSDDAAGILVAREMQRQLAGSGADGIDFAEAEYAGWRLVDLLAGYRRAIIVDAIISGKGLPGECFKIDAGATPGIHLQSSHGMGLFEAIELARQGGHEMPSEITVYAVEVKDPFTFGEELSEGLAGRIPAAAADIIREEGIALLAKVI